MAVRNLAGAQLGVRYALRYGNGFVRSVFLVTVFLLIGRFAWDTFCG
jgi:uncharacterized membrane protein YfcA